VIKEAADDAHFKKRYQLLFGALLSVVGVGMRQELSREEDFVRMLSAVAEKVKVAKDRDKDVSHSYFTLALCTVTFYVVLMSYGHTGGRATTGIL